MSLFLDFLISEISIYFGIPLLIAGLLGGCLNVIVFLSLRTFRRNSCAFYLVTMSSVDCGQLFTGLLSRIMISGFDIDWTTTSAFYCKFRYFIFQTCALISLTCLCLATMDQYLATCSRPRWQRWSDLKIAYRLTIIFSILWSLHGILYAVFIVLYKSTSSNAWVCGIVERSFVNYHTYCYLLVLTGILPILFTAFLGLLAYRNVRQLNYRSIPLVRQELEKQLTVMVLVQVISNVFTLLPYTIINVLALNPVWRLNAAFLTNLHFARDLSIFLYYVNFAVNMWKEFNECTCLMPIILVSVLHLHLCVRTIPPAVDLCSVWYSSAATATAKNIHQSNHTGMKFRTNGWLVSVCACLDLFFHSIGNRINFFRRKNHVHLMRPQCESVHDLGEYGWVIRRISWLSIMKSDLMAIIRNDTSRIPWKMIIWHNLRLVHNSSERVTGLSCFHQAKFSDGMLLPWLMSCVALVRWCSVSLWLSTNEKALSSLDWKDESFWKRLLSSLM